MTMCRWPLALFMTVASGASSLADDAIGYVAGLEGTAKVTRAGATRELLLGETIFRDDSVFADAPASVRIDTRGGTIAICGRGRSAGDCRRTFDQGLPVAPTGGWWARGVAMVSSFRSTPTNLVTRGSDMPALLLGRNKAQKIVAGDRVIALVWVQGEAPFEIRLSVRGRIIAQQASADRAITLPVSLPAGPASLTIADKDGRSATVGFTAVSAPPPIPDMAASAVNGEHRALLEAGWLASHENGAWLLEAFQRLQPIAQANPAAATLQRALASGDRP
jgi:hypothetical protein